MTNVPAGFVLRGSSSNDLPQGFVLRQPAPESPRGFGAFLNQGIATTLGAPVDLVNAGLGAVGFPVSDEPFGGSQSIASGLNSLGVRTASPSMTPETIPEYIGRGIGGATGALPMGGGIVAGLSRTTSPVARGAAETIARPFVATPGRALTAEVVAGGGSGLGESTANSLAPDNRFAEFAGSVVGGGLAGMAPAFARNYGPTRWAGELISSNIAPFTKEGGGVIARERVGNLLRDRDAAVTNINAPTIADLSPAVRTGDPALMSLEQAARRQSGDLDTVMLDQERRAAQQLTQAARDIAPNVSASEARDALSSRVTGLVARMDEGANRAMSKAEERINALDPQTRPAQSSLIVQEELENAYKAARNQEDLIWGEVPLDVKISTQPAKEAFRQVIRDTPRALQDQIPFKAKQFLEDSSSNSFAPMETAKEVHGLYSALREEGRAARASNNLNKARIANLLADSLLDDAQRGTGVGTKLRDAIMFSRQLNERYLQGEIGRLLSSDRTGAGRVAGEMALQSTVGRGGIPGALAIDKLRAATGESLPAIDDYMRARFMDAAVRNNRISPVRAETFLMQNEEVLNRMPNVLADIRQALTEQQAARVRSDRMASVGADAMRGPAATFSQARQGAEVDAILRSPDPARFARQAMLQAKDKGEGVKRAFIDDILKRSQDISPAGEVVTSGRQMMAKLADPDYRSALSAVMKREEISRLNQIASEFVRLEMMRTDASAAGNAARVGSVIDAQPSGLIATPLRIIAARLGARLGQGTSGASLQTASMLSRKSKELLNRLTNGQAEDLIMKAINDKDAFEALMRPTSRMTRRRENRLIETLTGIIGAETANQNGGE